MRLSLFRAAVLATALALPAAVPAPSFARGAPDSFADLSAQLLPSVVNISSSQSAQARNDRGPEIPGFPQGSPFEQFFRDFLDRNRPGQQGQQGQRRGERTPQPPDNGRPGGPGGPGGRAVSLGSGFIVDTAGYIVTNNHVI